MNQTKPATVAAVLAKKKCHPNSPFVMLFVTFWKEYADGEAEGDGRGDVEDEEEEHHCWIGMGEDGEFGVRVPFDFQ